ncbi:MAG: hypothetical protein H6675_02725 [Dehalococcoidia bacterium]|nr:hypothetical protein [Dehalococcoidia bacterium]
MNSVRGNLIYTAFATTVFIGIQWMDDVRDPLSLVLAGAMFFVFTFFMLRLIQRVMAIVVKGSGAGRRQAPDRDPGPATTEATTDRPEHARKRREARRPRGRRR